MKRLSIPLLAIASAGFLTTACNNNTTADKNSDTERADVFDINAVKKIIQDNNNAFMNAHITRDTATLNGMFTRDARVFPPNSEVIKDQATIKAINMEWVNYDIKEAREESTATYGNEDYVIDEGTYYMSFGADSIVDKGKYMNVWKKEDGKWKMFRNMWNTSLPAKTE
uniref:nuclear transport factor 2 family protein n=1 Tax=Mariniflexile sp. TaxID=1979402 RepID=UPI0040486E67